MHQCKKQTYESQKNKKQKIDTTYVFWRINNYKFQWKYRLDISYEQAPRQNNQLGNEEPRKSHNQEKKTHIEKYHRKISIFTSLSICQMRSLDTMYENQT